MSDNQTLSYIRTIMKNLNVLIILLISLVIMFTTYKITDSYVSSEFWDKIRVVPMEPWKVPIISIFSFLFLLFLMNKKEEKIEKDFYFFFYGTMEILLCLNIMYVLNFNYNSIILLVIADLLVCWKNSKLRISFFIILFMLYVITDFTLISNNISVIPLDTYLTYYNSDVRTTIITIKSILNSFNNLLFMFYMVWVIRVQILENERILLLNSRLDKANEKLQKANDQLEIYAKITDKMAETRERNRLAREIHDTLGHALTGIIAGIDACITLINYSPVKTKEQLQTIGNVARNGIKDVRRSVNALRPDALESLKLEDALNQVISEMQVVTNAKITFENKIGELNFDEDEEDAIYRIVQESVTNSIRHGKATEIKISLFSDLNIVIIKIKDNGVGCKDIQKGFGLRHMAERISMLNGKLQCDGNNGFTIIAKIPTRWRKK
ncbi:sensor histidine kinase [Anaerosacchariphilus polymeriproducens]|uniref:histidine kinase n=1 Tax=Anaerosacchariphilus polymeriproducens TaxID=1812858 RepID=A0A371AVG0_9FIRM|nr:sensor histidine kinase [Anaerosacchariphilus polymeriproducens]RDU23568.1 sensor histidine kinase [Anaerosacchariphilus polymeriproducens]